MSDAEHDALLREPYPFAVPPRGWEPIPDDADDEPVDVDDDERFYVREFKGIPIRTAPGVGGVRPVTSFFIVDRLYNYRVVETWDNLGRASKRRHVWLRAKAHARCAQLNEWWRAELKHS